MMHSFCRNLYHTIAAYKSKEQIVKCTDHQIQIEPDGGALDSLLQLRYAPERASQTTPSSSGAHRRRRRETSQSTTHPVVRTSADAVYLLIVKVEVVNSTSGMNENKNVTVEVRWHSSYGYLSAVDYPLLPFYE